MTTKYSIFAAAAAVSLFLFPQAHAVDAGTAVMQFNNLTVKQVINDAGFKTIVAEAPGNCIKFRAVDSSIGSTVPCPVGSTPSYNIRVDDQTKLLLRTRDTAQIGNFVSGDKINVYGLWSDVFSAKDGAIQGLTIRNLSRPEERRIVQLENLELVSISSTSTPSTLVAIQRTIYPCYDFGFTGNYKKAFPCPAGMRAFSEQAASRGITNPQGFDPGVVASARKYIVIVDEKTTLLGKSRDSITLSQLQVGDALNVFGVIGSDQQIITAQILRDLYKTKQGNLTGNYEGVITQITNDIFSIRLRDGRVVGVDNPFKVGAFVNLQGTLDELQSFISKVSNVVIKGQSEDSPVPIISYIDPGSGTAGSRVKVVGRGFAPSGNDINFGSVPHAVRNVTSYDGTTLSFLVPATTPCPPDVFCERKPVDPGFYRVSVTNASGTSESAAFQVTLSPPFSITTDSFAEAVQNQRYSVELAAQGGGGSYEWRVTSGNLPPGLSITPAQCFTTPCRAPATINGTPTVYGTYRFTVTLQSGDDVTSKELTIVVNRGLNAPY